MGVHWPPHLLSERKGSRKTDEQVLLNIEKRVEGDEENIGKK